MIDSISLLAKKQCFPTTKSLRKAVGVFFARHQRLFVVKKQRRRLFVASKNSGGKQKVYFGSGKEEGCPSEVRAFKICTG